jgi:hypothetical protein
MPQLKQQSVTPISEMTVILGALNALKRGDTAVRLPLDWTGVSGRVADVFNDVVERNERMAQELARLSRVVGKEGKLGKRGSLGDVTGFWRDSIDSVNVLIDDLVHPTSETARGDRRGRARRPVADDGARGRQSAAAGRIPAHREDRQQDGRSAGLVRGGSDARRARRWAPRASSAARRRSRAWPARGRT